MYLEPIQTSKTELFVKIINNLMPLTTSTKSSNSYFWSGSKNATKSSNKSFCEFNIFSLAAIWFNTFFLLLWKFLFLLIFKNISKFYCTRLIFIQTNNYIKTNRRMQISRCRQNKTMVSDNFKRNLHHFNMKKVEHVQLFNIKMKQD